MDLFSALQSGLLPDVVPGLISHFLLGMALVNQDTVKDETRVHRGSCNVYAESENQLRCWTDFVYTVIGMIDRIYEIPDLVTNKILHRTVVIRFHFVSSFLCVMQNHEALHCCVCYLSQPSDIKTFTQRPHKSVRSIRKINVLLRILDLFNTVQQIKI